MDITPTDITPQDILSKDILEEFTIKPVIMSKELNLGEILKGHKGETFYCSLIGEDVTLKDINNYSCIEVATSNKGPIELHSNGGFSPKGECQLFPSKDQRDWNKWFEEYKPEVPKTWDNIIKTNKISDNSILYAIQNGMEICDSDFTTPIEKSALALLKINQLIEVGYGGNVTKCAGAIIVLVGYYESDEIDYTIVTPKDYGYHEFHPFGFHTQEQAEEFLSYPENIRLLKDYFMV